MQKQNESIYRKSFNKSFNKVKYLFDTNDRNPLQGEFHKSQENAPCVENSAKKHNSKTPNELSLDELPNSNKTKKGSADPNLWRGIKKEMRGEIQAKPASVLFGGDFDDFYSDESPLNRQRYHGSSGLSSTANTASTLSTEMLDFLESAVNGGSEDVKSVISDDKSVVGNDNVKTAIIHSEYFEPVSYKDIFEQNGWKIIEQPRVGGQTHTSQIPTLIYEDGIYLYDKNTIKSNCLIKNQFESSCKAHLVNKEKLYTFVAGLGEEFATIMMKQYSGSQLSSNSSKKLFAEAPVWIVKPVGKGFYKGRGISVVSNDSEFKLAISAVKKLGAKSFVVAEYILNPMLYQGRKFHIRVHVMVGSDSKYIILDKMTRAVLALEPYKKADFSNKNIHDTHFTTRQNAVYDMNALLGEHANNVMGQIAAVIRACFSDFSPETYPEAKYAFETFGFDFMVTESGELRLIEINDKSGIAFDPEPFFAAVIKTSERLLLGEKCELGEKGHQNMATGGLDVGSKELCLFDNLPQELKVFVKMKPDYLESTEVFMALEKILHGSKVNISKLDTWDMADFIFRGKSSGYDDKLFRKLSDAKFGLINHFPSVGMLSNKANLAHYLQENKIAHIAPLTFVWDESSHFSVMQSLLQNGDEQTLWIVKPTHIGQNVLSFGGQGIQLLTFDQINKRCKELENVKAAVIQQYVANPSLYKGRKFDLRIYVLVLPKLSSVDNNVACESNLKAYLFWGGIASISLGTYNPKSSDAKVFMTNLTIQKTFLKTSNMSDENTTGTLDDITKDIFDLDCINADTVLSDICDLVATLFKPANINPNNYKSSFQIFGLDVILDANQKPLLLEVNSLPGLIYLSRGAAHKANVPNALNRAIEYAFKNRVGCEFTTPDHTRYEYTRIF